jgi:putative membrane protein
MGNRFLMENNFLDFRLINNLLLPSINYVSKKDLKKRNLLSILYGILFLIFTCILVVVVYQQIKPFILQPALAFANLYFLIDAIFSGKSEFLQYNITSTQSAHSLISLSKIIIDELVLLSKMLFPMIISLVTMSIFKKQNFGSKVIIVILTILTYTLFFEVYFQVILIIVLFSILTIFHPIGDDKYYTVVQYLNYFEEILYNWWGNRTKNKKSIKKIIFLIILSIVMSYCLFRLFPVLGVGFSFLLTLLVVFIIWVYAGSVSKEIKLLKKIFIYSIFFGFTLIGNLEIGSNVLKVPVLFITLFFALDRIIALSKEMKEIIVEKSILYYYEYETIDKLLLIKELINIDILHEVDVTELELVKQIAIRIRLGFYQEVLKLSDIYKNGEFQNYRQFVEGNIFFLTFDETIFDNVDSLKTLKERLSNILELEGQNIRLPGLSEIYAKVLFKLEQFNDAIVYFKESIMYMSEESRLMYIEACEQVGDIKQAEYIRRNY